MINLLKPVREIVSELNQRETKCTKILIHGVGRVQNVTYHSNGLRCAGDSYCWKFSIRLNDGILIKCSTYIRKKEDDQNPIYFEEGDWIEFWGTVHTHWQGIFCRYNISDLSLYDATLSGEERAYSDVLIWNAKTSKGYTTSKMAYTVNASTSIIDSQIAYVGELEEAESKWTYGTLVKRKNDVILQIEKVLE